MRSAKRGYSNGLCWRFSVAERSASNNGLVLPAMAGLPVFCSLDRWQARRCERPTKPFQRSRLERTEPHHSCSPIQAHHWRAISPMQAFLCRNPLPTLRGDNGNGKRFRSCELLG